MARDYFVATFDSRDEAYGAAMDIDKLGDSVVDVKGGAIVQKDSLGNVTLLDTKDLDTPWATLAGAVSGSLLGGLVGALAGPAGSAAGAAAGAALVGGAIGGSTGTLVDLTEAGIKEDYIAAVSSVLLPGHWAIVAEVDEYQTQPVDQIIWQHGGVIVRTPYEYPVV